jgi:hypothetical protein
MHAEVGTGFLLQLWLMGVAMSGSYRVDGAPEALPRTRSVPEPGVDDVAWRALETVAPGGLSELVDRELLLGQVDELASLICDAMRYGLGQSNLDEPFSLVDLGRAAIATGELVSAGPNS